MGHLRIHLLLVAARSYVLLVLKYLTQSSQHWIKVASLAKTTLSDERAADLSSCEREVLLFRLFTSMPVVDSVVLFGERARIAWTAWDVRTRVLLTSCEHR